MKLFHGKFLLNVSRAVTPHVGNALLADKMRYLSSHCNYIQGKVKPDSLMAQGKTFSILIKHRLVQEVCFEK